MRLWMILPLSYAGESLETPKVSISIIDVTRGGGVWDAPALPLAVIHIWQFPLTVPESSFLEFASLLSRDERERASRFHFERDARKFTVARGTTRSILSRYVGQTASDVEFTYSQYGKPSISNALNDIHFSVSHSGNFALVAVIRDLEVGVDIEEIREDVETDTLAERFFSEAERLAIRNLGAEQRVPAFFRCWTCKEAFLKAQGVGLSRPLGSFDVEVNADQPACLLATRPNANEAGKWMLYDIEAPPGYAAAVGVEGLVNEITIMRSES